MFGTLFLAAIIFLSISCAKNVSPPGGPEDKTPPKILEVFPSPNTMKVATDSEIKITFSESINRKTISDGIFISPLFEDEPEYKWKGKTLKIQSSAALLASRTYVVVVGTDVSDLHGNRLSYPFSFAFSTGDSLDIGAIAGNGYIENKPAKGLGIWAYALTDTTVLDPVNEVPDYITQTGDDGSYRLDFLAPGKYRLFAINDRNKDKLWDSDSEEYGTAPKDLVIDAEQQYFRSIILTAAKRDTLPPLISLCKMLPGSVLEVSFESDLDLQSALNIDSYKFGSAGEAEVPFEAVKAYSTRQDTRTIYIKGNVLEAGAACSLSIFNILSKERVSVDTSDNSCTFISEIKPDTTAPSVVSTTPVSGVQVFFPDSTIQIVFSELMSIDSVVAAFSLKDTLGNNVSGEITWIDDIILRFKPHILEGRTNYALSLDPAKTMDLNFNPMQDSIWVIRFKTMPSDTGGTVEGTVTADDSSLVVLTFLSLSGGSNLTFPLEKAGSFSFKGIPGGKYRLYSFLDLDKDGKYFSGGYKPIRFSEPRIFYPDTIEVRPRWETAGIKMELSR